jgi:hypothetical protein
LRLALIRLRSAVNLIAEASPADSSYSAYLQAVPLHQH